MDLDVRVTSVYVTYGVNDRVDVGLVLPIVQADFRGESFAQISPFGGATSVHYFAGTLPTQCSARRARASARRPASATSRSARR